MDFTRLSLDNPRVWLDVDLPHFGNTQRMLLRLLPAQGESRYRRAARGAWLCLHPYQKTEDFHALHSPRHRRSPCKGALPASAVFRSTPSTIRRRSPTHDMTLIAMLLPSAL